MYSQRVTIHPNPEKVNEVRTLLVQRAKLTQAAGQQLALAEVIAGKHAPEFTVTLLFNDLTAFDAARKRNGADAAFQKFTAKLASLVREPVAIELLEVVVPMPGVPGTPGRAKVSLPARPKRKAK